MKHKLLTQVELLVSKRGPSLPHAFAFKSVRKEKSRLACRKRGKSRD